MKLILVSSDENYSQLQLYLQNCFLSNHIHSLGAKGDWDFRISDLVKNPDGTDILTSVVNFGEVRRAQLAKSTLLTFSLVPLGSFQIF